MKGEGAEVGGWGVFTYYMCDITRSLSFSTKIQRTSAGQSPSPQNQEKNSQMYFLLTQRLQGHFFHCFSLCLLTFDLTDLSLHLS